MKSETPLPTTQRAYTLRLTGVSKEEGTAWREWLWHTHKAVNQGAKAFGEWLLTLRGGLSHTLTGASVPQGKDKADRPPTDGERQDRAMVLTLSWLSVESGYSGPDQYVVTRGEQPTEERKRKLEDALRLILGARGVPAADIDAWVNRCCPALAAPIRDGAVWVNRSAAFDEICRAEDREKARQDAQAVLWHILGKDYLTLPRKPQAKKEPQEQEEKSEEDALEEQRGAVIQSGKGAGQRTRHPFSHIFGVKEDSTGFGNPRRSLALRGWWRAFLKKQVEEASGIPFWDAKVAKRTAGERAPTELHREMFSKAASRLAQIHTKQKQQEVERQQRGAADEALRERESDASCREVFGKLDAYCERRGEETGAQGRFTIRPRQISQWQRVVAAWRKIEEPDPDRAQVLRVGAATQLQDELRDEKFGDINLFIALAAEGFRSVWSDDSLLPIYVKGKKAQADAERLKVAAYRHPDPYFNPVFCQFGVSRPDIEFRRIRAFSRKAPAADTRAVGMLLWDGRNADLRILLAASKRFDAEIGSACDAAAKGAATLPAVPRCNRLGLATLPHPTEGGMARVAHVFDRQAVQTRGGSDQEADSAGDSSRTEAKEKGPSWNGTLQADRQALDRIGRLLALDPAKAERSRRRLKWRLTVSLELQPQGPWLKYAAPRGLLDTKHSREVGGDVAVVAPANKKDEWRGLAYPFWHPANGEGRKGAGKHLLSQLPAGLRVLSVDLGHRYAAACAVWETLTCKQVEEACRAAERPAPAPDNLYLHLRDKGRTTVYRRLGPDCLGDGEHPSPWARLDRQFLIKLQGEETEARLASKEEREVVHAFEEDLRRSRRPERRSAEWLLDDLLADLLRTAELGLRRHAQRARIAHYVTAEGKTRPGGRVEPFTEGSRRASLLEDVLLVWCDLASGRRWLDPWAAQLWQEFIVKRLHGPELPQRQEDEEPRAWRKRLEEFAPGLERVVAALVSDRPLCERIRGEWVNRWQVDDGQGAGSQGELPSSGEQTGTTVMRQAATGWHRRLRWLNDWVLGRRKDPSIRRSGGLGLTRVGTLTALYQLQKAFRMRPTSDDPRRHVPAKGEDELRNFGRRTLDVRERLRENRVKQLASRIVAAALGLAPQGPAGENKEENRLERHARLGKLEQRFPPCHAIVIEDLTNYRPEQTHPRRENRQLMSWASAKVKKYLAEGCELSGLHLREVPPAYTSRQDARSGSPGIRCQDVSVREFMRPDSFWRREINWAQEHLRGGGGTAYDRFLSDLFDRWASRGEGEYADAPALRLPRRSGDVFVSVAMKPHTDDHGRRRYPFAHADLNAAANIGLRALLDPDWPGRWWYIPAVLSEDGFRVPNPERCAGAICLEGWKVAQTSNGYTAGGTPLKLADEKEVRQWQADLARADRTLREAKQAQKRAAKAKGTLSPEEAEQNVRAAEAIKKQAKDRLSEAKKAARAKSHINLWHDPSAAPLSEGMWQGIAEYENRVRAAVIQILQERAGLPR